MSTETHLKQNYIGGRWVDSKGGKLHDVINPATEEAASTVVLGTAADVDDAVAAAKTAFKSFSQTTREERLELLNRIVEEYKKRAPDLAKSMASEMGAPVSFAGTAQVGAGIGGFLGTIAALKDFSFTEKYAAGMIAYEPIGVVGMITPWNWPLNQIALKVAPALAAGNTMILKPSEECPGNAVIFAEILEAAGVPAGVFNLVQGDGPTVGNAISAHPGIEMVSFTGSTRAGILVQKEREAEAVGVIKAMFDGTQVGDPQSEGGHIGPVVNKAQFDKIQGLIQSAIDEGATLETGGTGLPSNVNRGYYIKPTVFSGVTRDMRIANEEIFGPVATIMAYGDLDEAVDIANDTEYGLSAVISGDPAKAADVAPKLRAGMVAVNAWGPGPGAAFGGYKASGNGREGGVFGLKDFMEVKSISGIPA